MKTLLAALLLSSALPTLPGSTPGAVRTTSPEVVCEGSGTRSVRAPEAITEDYKRALVARLPSAYSHRLGAYRLDDKIPLECGGESAPDNWWLEDTGASFEKDAEEHRCHAEVCDALRERGESAARNILLMWQERFRHWQGE